MVRVEVAPPQAARVEAARVEAVPVGRVPGAAVGQEVERVLAVQAEVPVRVVPVVVAAVAAAPPVVARVQAEAAVKDRVEATQVARAQVSPAATLPALVRTAAVPVLHRVTEDTTPPADLVAVEANLAVWPKVWTACRSKVA